MQEKYMSIRYSIAAIALCGFLASQATAGTVTGKVNFKGTKPPVATIKMNADPRCVKMHAGKDVPSQQVVINPNNTLQYVFVYVKKGLEGKKFPTPKTKVSIDQQGCMYHPHIFGMMVNQPI